MRLQPDDFDKVKELRRDVPVISPAAARQAGYPQEPVPPVQTCMTPLKPLGPCEKQKEDVSFACPRIEPEPQC